MDFYPGTYWHFADPNSDIFHNAFLGKGYTASISAYAHGEFEQVVTRYASFNAEQNKERLFEEIRAVNYPDCPTRLKAFYCFAFKDDADRTKDNWYGAQPKELVEVQILNTASVHVADSKLLDCHPDQWINNAHRYWQREFTNDPLLEIVIQGGIFFPKWNSRPFGLFNF